MFFFFFNFIHSFSFDGKIEVYKKIEETELRGLMCTSRFYNQDSTSIHFKFNFEIKFLFYNESYVFRNI